MRDQRALDFGGAHAMAGDVDDVVDAAGDPVIAVGVAAAAVAGEVLAGIGREIGLLEALMVAVDRAHLARPGSAMQRLPAQAPSSTLPSASTISGYHAEERQRRRAGLESVAPGSGVIRMPPVSVCHQVSTIGQRPSPTTR